MKLCNNNNSVVVIVIILFIYLIDCYKSQTVINYSILDNSYYIYNKYPPSSNSKYCNYNVNLLISISSTTSNINTIQVTNQPYPDLLLIYKPLISNDTSAISQFQFTNLTYGEHGINVILDVDSTLINIGFQFQCLELEVSQFSIKGPNRDKSNSKPYYLLYLYDLKSYLNSLVIRSSGTTIVRKTSNSNVFILEPSYPSYHLFDDFIVSVALPDNKISSIILMKFLNYSETNLISSYLPFNNQLFNMYNFNTIPVGFITIQSTSTFPYVQCDTNNIRIISGDGSNNKYTYITSFYSSLPYQISYQDSNTLQNISYNSLISNSIPTPIINSILPLSPKVELLGYHILVSIQFSNQDGYNYNFASFITMNKLFRMVSSFPYGFISGNNYNYDYQSSVLLQPYTIKTPEEILLNINPLETPFQYIGFEVPVQQISKVAAKLMDYKIDYLDDFLMILMLYVKDGTNIAGILINEESYYNFNSLVDGSSDDAHYEIIYNIEKPFTSFTILDQYGKHVQYNINDYYAISQDSIITNNNFTSTNVFAIENVSFLFNHLDITNKTIANIIYFSLPGAPTTVSIKFELLDEVSLYKSYNSIQHIKSYYSYWNSTLNQFQVEFFIPENTVSGVIPFQFTSPNGDYLHSQFLPDDQQLYVYSKNIDVLGPIITRIKVNYIENQGIEWEFDIDDKVNGFSYGLIQIRGEVDSSIYNITLNSSLSISGDKWFGTYKVEISLDTNNCYNQKYTIYLIELYDTVNIKSKYSKIPYDYYDSTTSVFHNYAAFPQNDLSALSYSFIACGSFNDPSQVTLLEFKYDEIEYMKKLLFNFSAVSNSGFKYGQLPIVYLTNQQYDNLECIPSLLLGNETHQSFSCEVELPFGEVFASNYYFSIYGFINNGGYYSGFSTSMLRALGFVYFHTAGSIDYKSIVITSTSRYSSSGGKLIIRGRGFTEGLSVIFDYGTSVAFISPDKLFKSAMVFYNVPPTSEPFIIFTSYGNSTGESNRFLVNPTIYDYSISQNSSSSSSSSSSSTSYSSSTSTSSNEQLPTNGPQECINDCGGNDKGYCTNNGCVCYSPYIGNDCSSSIIVIPQPSINESNPTIEIPIDQNNSIFKSLISLHSIRELDINQKQVNIFKFENWNYYKINNKTHQYTTTINGQVNVNATIQYFEDKTNITFANQILQMNPSSIKYSISISKYPFNNNLNTLQLVMSAQLESSDNNACSVKEYGETSTGDNSDYIKIQVDNISLYGRYVKRGIIDSTISSISNTLLDSEFNSINSNSKTQSYIGINIRNYAQHVILDPDWSILLDNRSAKGKNDSICKSKKLSTSQLAGIIIGSIAFASIIAISITYYLYKKKQHQNLIQNMENKLKNIN